MRRGQATCKKEMKEPSVIAVEVEQVEQVVEVAELRL